MKILRIVFCILSCLCVASFVLVAIFFGYWAFIPLAGAAVFWLLMVGAKYNFKKPKPEPKPDFMNTDEENAKINKSNDED